MSSEMEQLRAVAAEIEGWQLARKWSTAKMCQEFGGLGSTKTYKRILDRNDDLEELKVGKQLANFQAVLLQIEMQGEEATREDVYDDFADMVEARRAVAGAMKEQGNTRLVIVEGNPGTGKSAICDELEKKWPNVFVRAEATEIWKESPMAMLKHLLLAVGKREMRAKEDDKGKPSAEVLMPQCTDERQEKLFDQLNERKFILGLDEGHHLGPRTLNILKALINQTPTVVVMFAIPTLLARLTTKSYEEARQLTHNRLYRRVRLRGPEAGEVAEFVQRRGIKWTDKKAENECTEKLANRARSLGNWKFVLMASRKLKEVGEPLNTERFAKALVAAEKERF
jgi:DNA transposition AAA+ family ATPase